MKTVLIVEDELLIALAEGEKIKESGYKVIIKGSGEEAIDLIRQDERIDLILMDINLGDGIDGFDAANKIRKIRNIPIVFMTSLDEKEVIEKASVIGEYGYIKKGDPDCVLKSYIDSRISEIESGIKAENPVKINSLDEGESMDILIVDDEVELLETLKKMLAPSKYHIETASSPFIVLDLLCRRSFDVIITDYRMPGINGIDLLIKIKKINPDIEVILITAYGDMDTAIKAINNHAYCFFGKPIDFPELMKELRIIESKISKKKELNYLQLKNGK